MGPAGGGMLSVQEASVIGPGHFAVGSAVDNYDRDPLGLDIIDYRIAWRLGVTRRLELYGRYEISRAVSLPGTQEVPPPPLDIVDLTGQASIAPPYRTLYVPMPYLGDEPARFDDMTDGEYLFGAKWLLIGDPDLTPHVSVSVDGTVPGTLSAWKLRKGSGSGTADIGMTVAATWEDGGRASASANLGYTVTGSVRRADRLVSPHGIRELPIRRADLFRWGLGARYRIVRRVSVLAELAGWSPVGPHTPVQDNRGNADALTGLEVRWRGAALTVGFRRHLHPQTHGLALPVGPLAGAVDLSRVPMDARNAWLADIGAPATRPDANAVVVGLPGSTPLPEGARRIPEHRRTNTTGNDAITVALGFSF